MKYNSIDDILDFAIREEQAAADFYTDLAHNADNSAMRDALLEFSREEKAHKTRLIAVKKDASLMPAGPTTPDLKIADYTIDVAISSDMSYQDALIVAMKKEKAALKMYTDLAAAATDASLKQTLLALAQEEAKHKLRFEMEYDDLAKDM